MAFLMNDEKKNLALNENIRLDVSIEIPLIVDLDGSLRNENEFIKKYSIKDINRNNSIYSIQTSIN